MAASSPLPHLTHSDAGSGSSSQCLPTRVDPSPSREGQLSALLASATLTGPSGLCASLAPPTPELDPCLLKSYLLPKTK